MGLDNMRGSYGRCPPFLVGGLLVICVILTFNWWSLSSQNYDLIKQLDDLSEQLKISSEEEDLCVRQRLSFEGRVKSTEEEMAQLRVRLEQQRTENDDIKKQLGERDEELKSDNKNIEDAQSTAARCNTELESLKKLDISKDGSIASLRLDKDRLSSQLEERKQETLKLRTELEQVRVELTSLKHFNNAAQLNQLLRKGPTALRSKRVGELSELRPSAIHIHSVGLQGMIYHREPILPKDPPNAVRPKPSLSVTYLTPASAPLPKSGNVGIAVGGDHERTKILDMDKVDNEENNAGERVDGDANGDTNADAADPGQPEEAERMEIGEDNEDAAKKENGDAGAHSVQ